MTDGLTRKQDAGAWNTAATQCDGKTKFVSFTAANIRCVKYEGKRRIHLQPYRCGKCHSWHVGN
jgi:Zn finger protein HypA/HybF involved in hydrogenase expression